MLLDVAIFVGKAVITVGPTIIAIASLFSTEPLVQSKPSRLVSTRSIHRTKTAMSVYTNQIY